MLLVTNNYYPQAKKSISQTKPATTKKVSANTPEQEINPILSPAAVLKARVAVQEVLAIAGVRFKDGLIAYEDNKRSEAAKRFDQSVETFLYTTLNLAREPKLQSCYNRLVETIYRIEFPSDSQLPQIRNLSQTCNWNINNVLADKIAAITRAPTSVRVKITGTSPHVGKGANQRHKPARQ